MAAAGPQDASTSTDRIVGSRDHPTRLVTTQDKGLGLVALEHAYRRGAGAGQATLWGGVAAGELGLSTAGWGFRSDRERLSCDRGPL